MKFYLFISYIVWLFGAFTIVFVLSRMSDNIFITLGTLLITSSFFIFIFYKVTQSYSLHFLSCTKKIHTLTHQKKKLKVLDQMKTEFVSIASHQLRNPLTAIRGYTSMLLEGSYGKLPKKAIVAIENIAETSERMSASVEEYLNVSRIEAGNMKYVLNDFNIKNEAEHLTDSKRREGMKKGLLITFKSDLIRQGIVHADVQKVRQILNNLINNSLKYTPRGTITVFVHDHPKKKEVYIDVIDSGIGVGTDDLDDIFDKFERAHNATKTNVTGIGLGLFVARKMAHEMKGDVVAFSDGIGHGSTFRLILPIQM